MIAACKNTGFGNMISFFVNIFGGGTFRTITNDTKSFKFISVRFCNIAVINVNDWFIGNPFFNCLKIGNRGFLRNSLFKMSG